MSNGINFSSIMQIAEIALAAETGGASLAIGEAATQAFQQVATQALGSALQSSGVGDSGMSSILDAFGAGFDAATGNVGGESQEISQLASDVSNSAYQNGGLASSQSSLAQAMEQFISSMGSQQGSGSQGGNGDSWLVALARALGSVLGQKAQEIQTLSNQIPGESGDANKFNQDLTLLQGKSQEYGILANAVSEVLKSLGQGLQGIASNH